MPSRFCTQHAVEGGRRGREHDQVEIVGLHARLLAGLAQRLGPERRGRGLGVGDVALRDAGPLLDPSVRGIDHLLEVDIGHDPRGECLSSAKNLESLHVARTINAVLADGQPRDPMSRVFVERS